MFNAIEFIEKKRDGGRHSKDEFQSLIDGVMSESIPDYQLSAWLMAAYLNGLDDDETMYFTDALAHSGDVVRHSFGNKTVDKHSTGGVGDKVTIVLVPLVAACGAKVAKLSGPGLGYTGGTVDKLASIPGMNTHLSDKDFVRQIDEIGCAVSGHSLKLAPAEGRFYKLRDVTGTVTSIPLITASIISKKLASGASGFLFDVKCGSGALMRDKASATALAKNLVKVSAKLGKKSIAVLSDMEQPLGRWAGNAAEILEAVQVLSGGGPDDTRKLCALLGGYMLMLSGVSSSAEEGCKLAEAALSDGSALKKFADFVGAQGGERAVAFEPERVLPKAAKVHNLTADRSGFVAKLDALMIGEGLRSLGGGRLCQDDEIDPSVAVEMPVKIGDKVEKGGTVLAVHYNRDEQLKMALPYLVECSKIEDCAEKRELIIGKIE